LKDTTPPVVLSRRKKGSERYSNRRHGGRLEPMTGQEEAEKGSNMLSREELGRLEKKEIRSAISGDPSKGTDGCKT